MISMKMKIEELIGHCRTKGNYLNIDSTEFVLALKTAFLIIENFALSDSQPFENHICYTASDFTDKISPYMEYPNTPSSSITHFIMTSTVFETVIKYMDLGISGLLNYLRELGIFIIVLQTIDIFYSSNFIGKIHPVLEEDDRVIISFRAYVKDETNEYIINPLLLDDKGSKWIFKIDHLGRYIDHRNLPGILVEIPIDLDLRRRLFFGIEHYTEDNKPLIIQELISGTSRINKKAKKEISK